MADLVHPDDLDPVEVPSASKCPYCGGEPTEQSQARHSLSALDYLHDDVALTCSECRKDWTCGVPIGGPPPEAFADLWCDSCNRGWMLVHRVQVKGIDRDENGEVTEGTIGLHLKCPNHLPVPCPECGREAEPRFDQDGIPRCDACDHEFTRRELHEYGCFNFDVTTRPIGKRGIASTFYPHITGDTESAQPYGSPERR